MVALAMHEDGDSFLDELRRWLIRIEVAMNELKQQQGGQENYSVAEFARLVGRRPFTVREWCRHRRLNATKRACGRGKTLDWSIGHAELIRYRNEGLLPGPGTSTRI